MIDHPANFFHHDGKGGAAWSARVWDEMSRRLGSWRQLPLYCGRHWLQALCGQVAQWLRSGVAPRQQRGRAEVVDAASAREMAFFLEESRRVSLGMVQSEHQKTFGRTFSCTSAHDDPWPSWMAARLRSRFLAQVGIQAPRCIYQLSNPLRFLFAVYIAWPCCLSPSHQVWEGWLHRFVSAPSDGMWVQSWEEARHVQDLWEDVPAHQRHSVRLLALSKEMGQRRAVNVPLLQCLHVPAGVSWSDSPREQAVPGGEDAVMEDCTESHQSEISRKIKANDKLRNGTFSRPRTQRAHLRRQLAVEHAIHGRREGSSTGRQNTIPTLAKPDQKQKKFIWSESRKISRRRSNHVWKSSRHGSRQTRNWNQPSQQQVQAKPAMAIAVAEQTVESAKAVNQ